MPSHLELLVLGGIFGCTVLGSQGTLESQATESRLKSDTGGLPKPASSPVLRGHGLLFSKTHFLGHLTAEGSICRVYGLL